MSKPKWQEPLEQWGGHFILLGVVLATIHPALSIGIYVIREFTDWKLPWPMKGQWPPGRPHNVYILGRLQLVTQMRSVEDLRRDSLFTLIGTIVGSVLHEAILLYLTRG